MTEKRVIWSSTFSPVAVGNQAGAPSDTTVIDMGNKRMAEMLCMYLFVFIYIQPPTVKGVDDFSFLFFLPAKIKKC